MHTAGTCKHHITGIVDTDQDGAYCYKLCRSIVCTAAGQASPSTKHQNYVKVCGVTNPEDAELAASKGANMIGMILWPKAKRSIPPSVAREIAAAARRHGAAPVAVFVDEDAGTIVRTCEESDIGIAQLHGDGARSSLLDLPSDLQVVYVMHADKAGHVQTSFPIDIAKSAGRPLDRLVDWILLDGLKGGSGEAFDWRNLTPPSADASARGWLLAGGLDPSNVSQAISLAHPTGVDVSSGVCDPSGLTKDPEKVIMYVDNAWNAFAKSQER